MCMYLYLTHMHVKIVCTCVCAYTHVDYKCSRIFHTYSKCRLHVCQYTYMFVRKYSCVFSIGSPCLCIVRFCPMYTQYWLSLSFSEEAHNLRANTCTPTFEHIHFTCTSTDVYAWWWFIFLAGTARFCEAHMTSEYTYIHVRTNMCGVDLPSCRLRTTCGAINIPLNTQKYTYIRIFTDDTVINP